MQKPAQTLSVDQSSVDMKQRALCQCRQSLMNTVDHQIRATLAAVLRKSFRQSQMSTMGFIHDQRNPPAMYDLRYLLYIRNSAFIRR